MGAKYNQSGSFLSTQIGHHKEAIRYSLKRLWQSNLSTWITLAVIGVALCLPSSLYLLLQNMKSLTDDKHEVPTISLFVKKDISETPHIDLIINQIDDMERLAEKLENYPEIDLVQMDLEWVSRLRSILRISERAIFIISGLLALTVLLVIGNTIKLNIENRKAEIEVSKLIGASASYIRRPFLYTGIWYGLFGGVISLVLVHLALISFVAPVNELAKLYSSTFVISGLSIINTLLILFASSTLGLIGAWIAVGRHLRNTDITD